MERPNSQKASESPLHVTIPASGRNYPNQETSLSDLLARMAISDDAEPSDSELQSSDTEDEVEDESEGEEDDDADDEHTDDEDEDLLADYEVVNMN
ncbi:unnamed protein product [Caenorhabditis sp. 36 PRJEB53466]|nr:unnamed protein product [Caenorhabditis sp. 36 PRJEB53466]